MAEEIRKDLTFKVKAVDEATATLLRVQAETRKLTEETRRQATEQAKAYSTNGEMGKTLAMLRGGGAVGGITIGLNMLKSMTAEARKLKEEMEAGEISTGQLVERIAGSIPILGQAWKIGRDIRELITGEEAMAQKRLAAEKLINDEWLERKRLVQSVRAMIDPESPYDKKRREELGKFNSAINRKLGYDHEEALRTQQQFVGAGGVSYDGAAARSQNLLRGFTTEGAVVQQQQAAGIPPEVQQLIRERDRALAEIDEWERVDQLRKKPGASYTDVLQQAAKMASEAQTAALRAIREQVDAQTEQARKAASSLLETWFKTESGAGENLRNAGDNFLGRALSSALGIAQDAAGMPERRAIPFATTQIGAFGGTGAGMLEAERRASDQLSEVRKQTKALNDLRGELSEMRTDLAKIGVAR